MVSPLPTLAAPSWWRDTSTDTHPRGPDAPDPSGLAAGYMLLLCIVGCAALAALVGWPFGLALPLGLAGAAIGVVVGFAVVWVRFFRR